MTDMPLTDTLHLIAEISVAFAGFASLVSVIGRRRGRDAPEVDASRLRSMLESSLFSAAFALAPILAHQAGLSVGAAWRASATSLLVAGAFLIVHQIRVVVRLRRYGYRATRSWSVTASTLWAVALAAMLLTTIGALDGAFGYLLGLFAWLIYAGLLFVRLVSSLLGGSGEESRAN